MCFRSTEERAQKAEERSATAEADLTNAEEKIRELEKKIAKLEQVEGAPVTPDKPVSTSPTKVASPVPQTSGSESPKEKKRPESKGSNKSGKSKKK